MLGYWLKQKISTAYKGNRALGYSINTRQSKTVTLKDYTHRKRAWSSWSNVLENVGKYLPNMVAIILFLVVALSISAAVISSRVIAKNIRTSYAIVARVAAPSSGAMFFGRVQPVALMSSSAVEWIRVSKKLVQTTPIQATKNKTLAALLLWYTARARKRKSKVFDEIAIANVHCLALSRLEHVDLSVVTISAWAMCQ